MGIQRGRMPRPCRTVGKPDLCCNPSGVSPRSAGCNISTGISDRAASQERSDVVSERSDNDDSRMSRNVQGLAPAPPSADEQSERQRPVTSTGVTASEHVKGMAAGKRTVSQRRNTVQRQGRRPSFKRGTSYDAAFKSSRFEFVRAFGVFRWTSVRPLSDARWRSDRA